MNGDWSVLTELLLRLMHLPDEVNESFTGLGDSLFRPVSELELTYGPRLSILQSSASAASLATTERVCDERTDLCLLSNCMQEHQ